MSDLEKAKYILKMLSTTKYEMDAREAFSFTESYTWLLNLAKKMEEKANNADT